MFQKVVNTLLILTGPIIMALTQVWQIFVPAGLGEAIIAFLNLLLILGGGTVTLTVGVPALIRIAPKSLRRALASLY